MSNSVCNGKISVIIPVYNSGKTLRYCLNSIFEQEYKNLEIITIDDGSVDDSAEIINEYIKSGKKINYIFQSNSGAAVARNNGLSHATGEYVTFIDSDDYISKSFLSTLINSAGEKTDVVITGYTNVSSNGDILSIHKIKNKILSYYSNVGTCAKLYKRSFIDQNEIRFLENASLFEDVYFTVKSLESAKNVVVAPGAGYFVVENCESITHTIGKSIDVVDNIIDVLKIIKSNIVPKDSEAMDYFLTKSAIYCILFSCKGADKAVLYKKYDDLFCWIKENTKKTNKYFSFWKNYGETFSVKIIIKVFRFLQSIKLAKLAVYLYSRI